MRRGDTITSKKKLRINNEIIADRVRLVDGDGKQQGVLNLSEALSIANDASLDLVEISPQSIPPVCRLLDFGKYCYEDNKKKSQARKNQKQIHVKEIKFRPNTDIGDYNIKLQKLIHFLQNGDKAKVTVRFRRREIDYKEFGVELLERVESDLHDYGVVEQIAKLEGRQMVMVFSPKR